MYKSVDSIIPPDKIYLVWPKKVKEKEISVNPVRDYKGEEEEQKEQISNSKVQMGSNLSS